LVTAPEGRSNLAQHFSAGKSEMKIKSRRDDPVLYQNPTGIVFGLESDLYSPLSGGGYGNGSIVSVVP